MESNLGLLLQPLATILVLQLLLFCCYASTERECMCLPQCSTDEKGDCICSHGTVLTPDKRDCLKTMDVDVSYNPFSLVDEEAGVQFNILSLRSEGITNIYSIDATLSVGMDTLTDAYAGAEGRCMMMVFVEDSDEVAVAASNPVSGIGKANTFIEMNLETFSNGSASSLPAEFSEVFSKPTNFVIAMLISTAPCFVDENKFTANVGVRQSQSKEFSTSGEGISSSNPPLDVNVRLLTEFSKWALYHNMTAATVAVTPVQTSVITPTTVTDDQPPIITPESFLVPPPLSLNQTAVQGPSPSPSPAESLSQSTYGVTIALVVAITLILLIISVFVIVLTRGICCPRNRKKLARREENVPPDPSSNEDTFEAMENAAYNTCTRGAMHQLDRRAPLLRSGQRLGNVSYHIYEEIPHQSRTTVRREVQRSASESQMYATPYRRNQIDFPVHSRADSLPESSSISGAYVNPDFNGPVTAATALSRILTTARGPPSQDTILEEELELDDEEDGMNQNSIAIENEYLELCQ